LYLLVFPSLPGGSVSDWLDSLIGPDGLLLVVCLALAWPGLACNLFCSPNFSFMGGVGKK
jgi:hypothetical protein